MRNCSVALFLCGISLGSCLRKIIEDNGIVSQEGSNASRLFHKKNAVHQLSNTSVSELAEDAMDQLSDASVSELAENAMDEKSDGSVSEDADNIMDELSDASVSEDAEDAMDELSDASVNELAENAMDELSDASVSEDADDVMDEISDASVSDLSEIDTSIYQPTFADVNAILKKMGWSASKAPVYLMKNQLQFVANDASVKASYKAVGAMSTADWIDLVKEKVYFWMFVLYEAGLRTGTDATPSFFYACFLTRALAKKTNYGGWGKEFNYGWYWKGGNPEKEDYKKFQKHAMEFLKKEISVGDEITDKVTLMQEKFENIKSYGTFKTEIGTYK